MKFEITNWTIKNLYDTYNKGDLNLSPPYQRNFIWSTQDQQTLVDSISKNIPIPNFFLLEKDDLKLEGSTLKLVKYMFYSNLKYKWINIQEGLLGWNSSFYEIDLSGSQPSPVRSPLNSW